MKNRRYHCFENMKAVFDKKRNLYLLVLLFVLITRIPFLNVGFGLDGDAWIVEEVAHRISEQHQYAASRIPGYPVFELLSALVIMFGPIGTNTMVMIFSIGAFLAFAYLCYLTKTDHPILLTITTIRQCLVKDMLVSPIQRVIAGMVKKRRLPGFLFG